MNALPGLTLLLTFLSPLAQADLIDDVYDRGELRIAMQADSPPFNYSENGRLTGFAVELGELLAKDMEVHASFIATDSVDLLSGVESGKYDVAFDPVTIPAELKNRYSFSDPYIQLKGASSAATGDLAIAMPKGNPAFQEGINNALRRLKESGRLAALSQKWQVQEPTQPDQ